MAFETFAFHTRYVSEPHAVLCKAGVYEDGSTVLQVKSRIGEALTTATVNLSMYNESPREGYVFIKDHGPNEGVVEALHGAGIIGQPERWLNAGFVTAYAAECKLLVEVE